jgi:DNA-binding MarR family transcriptional regulator
MIHNDAYTSKRRDALSQLMLVTTLMTSDMQRGLSERGLTLTRAHVLWVLGEAGEVTQRELAQTLQVTPRNVTALIDALEETGFVRRSAHPTDRRAIVVGLTPKGQKAVATLATENTAFALQLFGDLTDGELSTFHGILNGIGQKLTALAEQVAKP